MVNVNRVNESTNNKDKQSIDKLNMQMESLSKRIPETTTEKNEKLDAIRVKNEIIRLKRQMLALVKDPDAKKAINEEIKILEGERDTIQSEVDAMTTIFDKQSQAKDKSTANNKPEFKNSVWS